MGIVVTKGFRASAIPTYADDPTSLDIGSSRFASRDKCLQNKFRFYCDEPGHHMAGYRMRPARGNTSRVASWPDQVSTSFRTNKSSFRRIVEDEAGDDVVLEIMQLYPFAIAILFYM